MTENSALSKLVTLIKSEIEQSSDQSISFYRWMELCLYHPEYGYYMKPGVKVGKEGDFYTVSSVGPYFGEQLVSTFKEMILNMNTNRVTVLEWGGGDGRLSEQMLSCWRNDSFLANMDVQWVMLELSPDHKQKQIDLLEDYAKDIPIRWITNISELTPDERQAIIIFSNELLDAFPVYRVKQTADGLQEMRVTWSEEQFQFVYKLQPASEKLISYLNQYDVKLEDEQEAEINLDQEKWMKQLATHIGRGYVLTIDYGEHTEWLYSPMRPQGTAIAYYKHRGTNDVLSRPGEQDLTSHVHFTACIKQGKALGLDTMGLLTQREFLLNSGIVMKLSEHYETNPFQGETVRRNRLIRQLLMPGGFSDSFKVLIQSKGVDPSRRLTCLVDYFQTIR